MFRPASWSWLVFGVAAVLLVGGFKPTPAAADSDLPKVLAAVAVGALVYEALDDDRAPRYCPPPTYRPPARYPKYVPPRPGYNQGYRHGFNDGYRTGYRDGRTSGPRRVVHRYGW